MTEHEIERMLIRLVGDATGYLKMLGQAGQATQTFAQKVEKDLTTLATRVALPLTVIGAFAVKSFSDFDKALTESTSIMGDLTIPTIEKLRQTALDLSTSGEIVQGPTELAKAYFNLASAGFNAEQSIALLPQVSKFATAGVFDLSQAIDFAAGSMSALGLRSENATTNAKNLTRVTDVLVKANIIALGTTKDFAEALSNDAAAAMRVFNVDVEEGVAVLAAYAEQNNKGLAAGSDFARFLRLAAKAANDNKEAHQRLGFAVFDAAGNLRNMADIVQNLEQVLGDLSPEARTATLEMLGFEARIQNAILPLIGMSKRIRQFEGDLRKAGGTTQEVAAKQMKSFANQIKIIQNSVTVAAIDIGGILAPALLVLANATKDAVTWFKNLSPTIKTVIVFAAALTFAVITLTGAILIAGTVFNTMFGGIGLIIGAIVVVAAALIAWESTIGGVEQAWNGLVKVANQAWNVVLKVAKSVMNALQPAIQEITVQFTEMWSMIKIAFEEISDIAGETFKEFADEAGKLWVELLPIREALGGLFLGALKAGLNALKELLKASIQFVRFLIATWREVKLFISAVWFGIKNDGLQTWFDLRDGAVEAITRLEFAIANFGKLANFVWLDMKVGFFKFSAEFLHFFTSTVPTVANWLVTGWGEAFNRIWDIGKKVFKDLTDKTSITFKLISNPEFWNQGENMRKRMLDLIWGDFSIPTDKIFSKLPDFAPRIVGEAEKGLDKARLGAAKDLSDSFDKFMEEKVKRKGIPNIIEKKDEDKIVQQADELGKKLGKGLGAAFVDETVKEVKKLDAVLFGSAEALSRLNEFREKISQQLGINVNTGQGFAPAPINNPIPTQPIPVQRPMEQEDAINVLKDIKLLLDKIEKKPLLNSTIAAAGTR